MKVYESTRCGAGIASALCIMGAYHSGFSLAGFLFGGVALFFAYVTAFAGTREEHPAKP